MGQIGQAADSKLQSKLSQGVYITTTLSGFNLVTYKDKVVIPDSLIMPFIRWYHEILTILVKSAPTKPYLSIFSTAGFHFSHKNSSKTAQPVRNGSAQAVDTAKFPSTLPNTNLGNAFRLIYLARGLSKT